MAVLKGIVRSLLPSQRNLQWLLKLKKASRANFLKEYWGIRNGGDRKSVPQNEEVKTNQDLAEAIGELRVVEMVVINSKSD